MYRLAARARMTLDLTAPDELAAAALGDGHPLSVVAAAAAEQVTAVGAFRAPHARPTGGTCGRGMASDGPSTGRGVASDGPSTGRGGRQTVRPREGIVTRKRTSLTGGETVGCQSPWRDGVSACVRMCQ